ncbi:MAG: hypothetical protein NTU76_02160 [Candidatus Taylorbacteria bacterium]|nr:hypothetical protein [Candidatus Taylorbacteria bacterium]
MSAERPDIKMEFVRHGDHDQYNQILENKDLPLVDESIEKLRELRETLGIKPETTAAWSGDNKRSIDTCNILLNHQEQDEIEGLEKNYKIAIDPNLLYKKNANFKDFKDYLGLPEEQKKVFRAIVEHSEEFKRATGSDFTSYADLCNAVVDYVIKYTRVLDRWEKISFKYSTQSLFRIFCANEYFYSSFRSLVELVLGGNEARDKYVSWYEDNFERNEDRKHEEQSVTISRNNVGLISIVIKDSYGEISINLDQLTIIKSMLEDGLL